MDMLGEDNRDDLRSSARHNAAESRNRHEKDNTKFLALLKTVSRNKEILALVPVWVNDHVDHRKNASLTNAIASSESASEFVSLKFQAIFFNYLKVESKLLEDLKSSMKNYGLAKSVIN